MWRVGRLEVYDKQLLILALDSGEWLDSSFRRFIPENHSQHTFDGYKFNSLKFRQEYNINIGKISLNKRNITAQFFFNEQHTTNTYV